MGEVRGSKASSTREDLLRRSRRLELSDKSIADLYVQQRKGENINETVTRLITMADWAGRVLDRIIDQLAKDSLK